MKKDSVLGYWDVDLLYDYFPLVDNQLKGCKVYIVKMKSKDDRESSPVYFVRGGLTSGYEYKKDIVELLSNRGFFTKRFEKEIMSITNNMIRSNMVRYDDSEFRCYMEDKILGVYKSVVKFVNENKSLFPKRSEWVYDSKYHSGVILDNIEKYGEDVVAIREDVLLDLVDFEYPATMDVVLSELALRGLLFNGSSSLYRRVTLCTKSKVENVYVFKLGVIMV